jgi:hypothetical protein
MNIKLLKLIACIAWTGAAIASASPAAAIAITNQTGPYATCSNDSEPYPEYYCDYTTSYIQTMRVVSTTCSSGSCGGSATSFTDTLYSPGRKITSLWQTCGTKTVYGLTTCAC